jgi:hypothetical protein
MKTVKEYAKDILNTVTDDEAHRNFRVDITYKLLAEPLDRVTENDMIMLASDLLQKFEYKFGDDFELFWETVINKLKEG